MDEPARPRRVRAVLQSRLSSDRLPAKAMLTVAGRPMVVLAAQRAASRGAEVVVATSDRPDDDLLAEVLAAHGVVVVRGPLEDTLARFVLAVADLDDADVVVRLTADNVVPDGDVVDLVAREVLAGRDYARVGGDDPALPYGVAAEAFTAGALRTAAEGSPARAEREHVTPGLRAAAGDHRLEVPDLEASWAGLRCTVDTFDDYVRVARLFEATGSGDRVPWRELVARLAAQAPARTRSVVRRDNALGQSALVLGAVQLGLPYGRANASGMPDRERARTILEAAVAAGVTHVDTARAYGESEQRLGALLRRGTGEQLAVVTKLRPLDDVPPDADPAWGEAAVSASVHHSLHELRGARLDALLVHRAADWHRPGVRAALLRTVEEGRARVVGASLSTPEELRDLLADPALGYVQLPFNLLDRRWLGPEVQQALAQRPEVVVTVRSAYLQGLLVADHAAWPAGHEQHGVRTLRELDKLVAAFGRRDRADLCLAYVLAQPWVTSVVVGAELPAQVAAAGQSVATEPLTPGQVDEVHAALPPGPDDLVDPATWRSA